MLFYEIFDRKLDDRLNTCLVGVDIKRNLYIYHLDFISKYALYVGFLQDTINVLTRKGFPKNVKRKITKNG